MLRENQMITGSIQQIDDTLSGIMKVQQDVVFVRHVLLKEEVKVRIVKHVQKGYIGEVVEIIKPSPSRVSAPCGIYERCGSCHLLHMDVNTQAMYKKSYVEGLCKKAKGLSLHVQDVMRMPSPYHYRNKMIVGFTRDRNRKIQAGFYEEHSHNIIPYDTCVLHYQELDEIVQTIVSLMSKFRVEPYLEDKRQGLFRHVLIRYGEVSKQIMVVFVLNAVVFPARKDFVNALLKAHPTITTILQNTNTRKTSVVLGDQERVLYGAGYIEDTLCGLKFRISAKSFYQINHFQTEVLYKTAIGLLNLRGNEVVMDAYCGIGTIGMYASSFVKQVIGVEINKDAIGDAKINAQLNHIKNIRFLCDDAGTFMSKMAAKHEKLDVVIMDPPRSGSTEEFLHSLLLLSPKQVLYISCNPQTQLRDLEYLKRFGYVSKEIYPVDMFPNTAAVESIVLLHKSKDAVIPSMRTRPEKEEVSQSFDKRKPRDRTPQGTKRSDYKQTRTYKDKQGKKRNPHQ